MGQDTSTPYSTGSSVVFGLLSGVTPLLGLLHKAAETVGVDTVIVIAIANRHAFPILVVNIMDETKEEVVESESTKTLNNREVSRFKMVEKCG
jgi:hypothetical protein